MCVCVIHVGTTLGSKIFNYKICENKMSNFFLNEFVKDQCAHFALIDIFFIFLLNVMKFTFPSPFCPKCYIVTELQPHKSR